MGRSATGGGGVMQCAAGRIPFWTDNVLTEFPNTVQSAHGLVTARFTTERPVIVLPVSKTFALLGVNL